MYHPTQNKDQDTKQTSSVTHRMNLSEIHLEKKCNRKLDNYDKFREVEVQY